MQVALDVHEKKNPEYAPYVMLLILDKVPSFNTAHFTIHKLGTLQKLKHEKPSTSRFPFQSSDEEEAFEAPMPRTSKSADPPSRSVGKQVVQREMKKISWWKRPCYA